MSLEIYKQLQESARIKQNLAQNHVEEIEKAFQIIIKSLENGGKLITAGNGGSASDASHIATELVGRYKIDRPAIPSIALTADSTTLTAIANDYGYPEVFARQLQALGKPEDVFLAISTSGNSENLVTATRVAKTMKIDTIGLLGKDGGRLLKEVDHYILVPSDETPRIQEAHITIGHILCSLIEERFTK